MAKTLLQQNSRMARIYGWTFTLNDYRESDVILIKGLVGQRGIKYICFGREVGELGRPHLQGYFQSTQKQLTRLLLAFDKKPHLERQKGETGPNEAELAGQGGQPWTAIGYCMKDGDFFETGEKVDIKPTTQGQRTDLEGAMKAVKEGKSELELYETHSGTVARYPKFIERYSDLVQEKNAADSLREEYKDWSLYAWQAALKNTLEQTPDPRKILWIWSNEGKMGKSGMAMWLMLMMDACILSPSKLENMIYAFSKNPKRIVIFDCTRVTEKGSIGPSYSMAEMLKNGYLFSSKYNSRGIVFKKPHVIFFTNFEPDRSVWSEDRYVVTKLDQTSL